MKTRDMLEPYQVRTVEFIKEQKKCALWIGMGLGKTVSTLTAIVDLFDECAIGRVLVIAPKKVASMTWREEVQQWAHTQGLSVAIAVGTENQRRAAINTNAHITCINRENVQWLEREVGLSKKKWHWDVIVLDESSSFKNPDSKRFKALRRITKRFNDKIDYIVQLTGTPAANGYLNIWSQIFLLDHGERLYKNFKTYKMIYFSSDYMGFKYDLIAGADEQIQKKVSDCVLVLNEEDYLDLPDVISRPVLIDLTDRQLKQYNELAKDFLIQLSETEEIEAVNAGVLYGKLCQFATGDCYAADGKTINLHDEKLDRLVDVIEEANGQNVLLAYNFKHERDKIMAKFSSRAYPKGFVRQLQTDQDIQDWNEGKIKLAIAHPASIGHGLNLQFGGNIIIWYSTTSDLELYLQFNKRLHRRGQKGKVSIYHLITRGTVEEVTVLPRIEQKQYDQQQLVKAVQAYANSIVGN